LLQSLGGRVGPTLVARPPFFSWTGIDRLCLFPHFYYNMDCILRWHFLLSMPFFKVPISLAEIQSFHTQLFFSLVFFWFFGRAHDVWWRNSVGAIRNWGNGPGCCDLRNEEPVLREHR
jgi:hypothetical protein